MALGAQRSDILRMVLSQGMRLVMTGLAVGVIASLWTNRSIQNMLYGVKLTDASVYAAVALVLMAISALALYFPAHRATTVNPMSILRDE